MKKKLDIFCTLGPASLNEKFLKFSNSNISLLRLNLSHIQPSDLPKLIKKIRNFSKVPICLDTEGAQIRTKVFKKKFFKENLTYNYDVKNNGPFLYPNKVIHLLKKNDILDIGFVGLKIKILKKDKKKIRFKVIKSGFLENNKGVHLVNRQINLPFLTEKDIEAIKIAKNDNIKHFALSFTNSIKDIQKFTKILSKENKIYKLETKKALKNLDKIMKAGQNFIIDRGDLSKDISVEQIPVAQRTIINLGVKSKKKIFVATNFLESMIQNDYPHRGEINDIYSTLELGASGLVLAAETAIGKNPIESVKLLKKIFKTFIKNKK
jgi:pyruvate kinase